MKFGMQVTAEDSKAAEISKLEKALESLNAELEAAKLATISERDKNALLQIQLELSIKDQKTLRSSLAEMAELKKENLSLKAWQIFNLWIWYNRHIILTGSGLFFCVFFRTTITVR